MNEVLVKFSFFVLMREDNDKDYEDSKNKVLDTLISLGYNPLVEEEENKNVESNMLREMFDDDQEIIDLFGSSTVDSDIEINIEKEKENV